LFSDNETTDDKMRIYVGNLPWTTADGEVKELFSQFGPVTFCKLVFDRETGRPRGFGFVELPKEAPLKVCSFFNFT
jgi:RNA recognition motif-containing protein